MAETIRVGERVIGDREPPLIVAEMSGNHAGSLERALALVDAAADAGADAIKLQTYTAETMTLDVDEPGFRIDDPDSLWNGASLHSLYERAHTPWEWHAELFARARERGLLCFSSPFDATAVELLEGLGAPAYKIASFELVDLPLVRCAAETGKPLVLSTGMASEEEIGEAVDAARGAGCHELVLLECTSAYPAEASDAHLRTMPALRERFGTLVGLSDHTDGVTLPVAAIALGACLVEKHFTLGRDDGAVDSAFSLDPDGLRELVRESRRAHDALGEARFGPRATEEPMLAFRRSLYFVAELAAGDVVRSVHVRSIRPAGGLAPKHLGDVVGRRLTRDVGVGTPVAWDLLD